jgi:glycosyltransferase involved in cell wall biosynthesis
LDVCVSAALEEPLGLTIPEALGMGCAVVATDVGGLPENVRSGHTGLLVPPRRPRPMARAITRLLTDDTLRAELGEAGRCAMRAKYKWERDLDRVEAIFQHVAGPAARLTPAVA